MPLTKVNTAMVSSGGGDIASNTALGLSSLTSNTTGANNTAVGYFALKSTAGNTARNTAVGSNALQANTSGEDNTALGYQAGNSTTTGTNNIAIGSQSLYSNTTANWNVGVGTSALFATTTSSYNVGIGGNAGAGITTGSRNTCLGHEAGNHTLPITTGNYNTILGAFTLPSGNNAQYQICLGYDVVCIGDNYFTFGRSGNRVYNEFTANASWTRSSDVRLKKDINTNTELGLSFINDLRTVTYKWKAPSEIDAGVAGHDPSITEAGYKNKMYGFIAQEVKESLDKHGITDFAGWHVTPENQGAIQGVSYEMFVVPLVKAIQELKAEVDSLKAQLNNTN